MFVLYRDFHLLVLIWFNLILCLCFLPLDQIFHKILLLNIEMFHQIAFLKPFRHYSFTFDFTPSESSNLSLIGVNHLSLFRLFCLTFRLFGDRTRLDLKKIGRNLCRFGKIVLLVTKCDLGSAFCRFITKNTFAELARREKRILTKSSGFRLLTRIACVTESIWFLHFFTERLTRSHVSHHLRSIRSQIIYW